MTQAEWLDLVVTAWKKDLTIWAMMQRAECKVLYMQTHDDWVALLDKYKPLKPRIPSKLAFTTPVKAWIASRYSSASTCLWDGKDDAAKRWLASGKDSPGIKSRSQKKAAREAFGAPVHPGERFIAHELNTQKSNWHKCK